MNDAFLQSVGGKKLKLGRKSVWNFGYVPPLTRTRTQHAAVGEAQAAMPKFTPPPHPKGDPKQALLYELWKHPDVVAANGFAYPGTHQLTGSCVGAGGGNCWMTLACVEAVRLGDPEIPLVPFWLLPYGRSRLYMGDSGQGEGSTGSTFAQAAREDGCVPANTPGLPSFTKGDGLIWGKSVEMKWSDGDSADSLAMLPASRRHLVRTTAQCRSADDVRAAIVAGYPCTCASMYAHDGGTVQSDPPICVGRKSGEWAHQMSLQAWIEHPKLGELFYLMNQWGLDAHTPDPFGAPLGGVWVKKADVNWICRDEVFAFSQFGGFPAPTWNIPWLV